MVLALEEKSRLRGDTANLHKVGMFLLHLSS